MKKNEFKVWVLLSLSLSQNINYVYILYWRPTLLLRIAKVNKNRREME